MGSLERHAFLITAHQLPKQLALLVDLLDHPLHDILIQTDATGQVDGRDLRVAHASLTILEPIPIYWGGYSQVDAQLRLMRAALQVGPHAYLHMLSGQDLPLLPPEEMHARLRGRRTQFLQAQPQKARIPHWKIAYYHPFVESGLYRSSALVRLASHVIVAAQSMTGLDRARALGLRPVNMSPSFCITDDLASWLVARAGLIRAIARHSISGDEVYVGTLLGHHRNEYELSDQSTESNLFHVVYSTPGFVLRTEHLPSLRRASDTRIFARKFDERIDAQVIEVVAGWVRA